MKQIELDHEDERIKRFIRKLPVKPDGVELKLGGKVIRKVIGPNQLSDAEKNALIERGRELVNKARKRNQGVPANVLEREVRDAIDEVRRVRPYSRYCVDSFETWATRLPCSRRWEPQPRRQ